MTSSIILGSDVNEKVLTVPMKDLDSGIIKNMPLYSAYWQNFIDFSKIDSNPLYLFSNLSKYLPFGPMAAVRKNNTGIV